MFDPEPSRRTMSSFWSTSEYFAAAWELRFWGVLHKRPFTKLRSPRRQPRVDSKRSARRRPLRRVRILWGLGPSEATGRPPARAAREPLLNTHAACLLPSGRVCARSAHYRRCPAHLPKFAPESTAFAGVCQGGEGGIKRPASRGKPRGGRLIGGQPR